MKLNLLKQQYRNIAGTLSLALLFSAANAQQAAIPTINIPTANVRLISVKPISPVHTRQQPPVSPATVSANAVYSDVTTFSGSGANNGIAATVGGIRMSAMLCDSLILITPTGMPPYTISSLTFTPANFNTVAVTCTPKVRFYLADGTGGKPGTYIAGYNLSAPYTFNASSVYTFMLTLPAPYLTLSSNYIWAGVSFDNSNNPVPNPTIAQLKLMGAGLYNPPDIGTSGDNIFETTAAGDFTANNPAGTIYPAPFAAGGLVGNFGWELVSLIPTPVTIEYIHGVRSGRTHNLSWKVDAINTPQVTMSLERSTDNRTFTSIYSTTVSAARCQQPFSYPDGTPSLGVNYYRLLITDADGKKSYSSIVSLLNQSSGFQIINVTPNPATNGVAQLNIASALSDQMQVAVYDMTGKRVLSQNQAVVSGSNQITLNVSTLASGQYQIRVTASTDGSSQTVKLIKQ